MEKEQLIAAQAIRIKELESQCDVYQRRIKNVGAEIEYLHEYLKILKNNLNKHMSNPRLYPKHDYSRRKYEN